MTSLDKLKSEIFHLALVLEDLGKDIILLDNQLSNSSTNSTTISKTNGIELILKLTVEFESKCDKIIKQLDEAIKLSKEKDHVVDFDLYKLRNRYKKLPRKPPHDYA